MAPRKDLKIIQQRLARYLADCYTAPPCVHGFVPGKSVVTNAYCHVSKQAIVELDIENFFPSITPQRVFGLLVKLPQEIPPEVAYAMSRLVCTVDGLPQGAPSSPVVANMICRGMDKALMREASKIGAFYTRYADDITLSFGNKNTFHKVFFPNGTFQLPESITTPITTHGPYSSFKINDSKTRYRLKCSRQCVTGLTTNEKTNLPRAYYRTLRACLYRWQTEGKIKAAQIYYHQQEISEYQINSFENVIRGHLAYYAMVLAKEAESSTSLQKLGSAFNSVCDGKPYMIHNPADSLVRICTESTVCGEWFEATGFVLEEFGIVTSKHTFANAKKNAEGHYDAIVNCPRTGNTCRIIFDISPKRKNPQYDFIVLPLSLATDKCVWIKKRAPLRASDSPPLAGKSIRAFRTIPLGDSKTDVEPIDGLIKRANGRPNQHGSLASVGCAFYHGMSGGPVINANNRVVGIVYDCSDDKSPSRYLAIESIFNAPENVISIQDG